MAGNHNSGRPRTFYDDDFDPIELTERDDFKAYADEICTLLEGENRPMGTREIHLALGRERQTYTLDALESLVLKVEKIPGYIDKWIRRDIREVPTLTPQLRGDITWNLKRGTAWRSFPDREEESK